MNYQPLSLLISGQQQHQTVFELCAQDMDNTAARVRDQLAEVTAKKRETAAGMSAADRDVILWDQRLQQELDMQVLPAGSNLPRRGYRLPQACASTA